VDFQVEALLAIVDKETRLNLRPCKVSKETVLEIRKGLLFLIAFKMNFSSNLQEFLHLTYLFNHCLRLGRFRATWKQKLYLSRNVAKYPKFSQNLRPISLLSTTEKLFEKLI
jgi:hypothetical protein